MSRTFAGEALSFEGDANVHTNGLDILGVSGRKVCTAEGAKRGYEATEGARMCFPHLLLPASSASSITGVRLVFGERR